MAKCWRFYGWDIKHYEQYEFFACRENAYYQPEHGGQGLYVDGRRVTVEGYAYETGTCGIEEYKTNPIKRDPARHSGGSCDGCLPSNNAYDCINGSCIPKTQYNTPGKYNSLADCQAVCGVASSDFLQARCV